LAGIIDDFLSADPAPRGLTVCQGIRAGWSLPGGLQLVVNAGRRTACCSFRHSGAGAV